MGGSISRGLLTRGTYIQGAYLLGSYIWGVEPVFFNVRFYSMTYYPRALGWQTEECRYGPERGVGVGDDKNSCAFDGARCKVWSGPPSEQVNNDYGREWSYGDVLSCLFSWSGEVSFWLNGVDMGVAFRGLNPGVNWYPAASIAMDQHCSFNFGSKPFRCGFNLLN